MSSAPVTSIPTIDVSSLATGLNYDTPEAHAVAKLIDDTCRNMGFLLVKGHGVRPETKANFLAKMKEFFDEPAEKKNQIAIGKSAHHRGYVAMGMENLEGALANTELGKNLWCRRREGVHRLRHRRRARSSRSQGRHSVARTQPIA